MFFFTINYSKAVVLIHNLLLIVLRRGSDVLFFTDCSKAVVLMYFLLLNVLRRGPGVLFDY